MKNFCRKLLALCSVLFVVSTSFLVLASPSTFADDKPDLDDYQEIGNLPDPKDSSSTTGPTDDCAERSFLGFVPWDCGIDLNNISGTDGISKTIWSVAGNVATDITVAASYLVLGYVIYGGYLYIFSDGDPSKVATGKKTLAQAFIGLAIVMSASIILKSVRIALNFGSKNLQDCLKAPNSTTNIDFTSKCANSIDSANAMVTQTIQWVVGIAGAVALIFVVYGAIMYITSAGDAGKVQKAKNLIMYSLIGLVIVGLAEIVTAFVASKIRDSVTSASTTTSLIMPSDENPPGILPNSISSNSPLTTLININEKEPHAFNQIC